MIDDNEDFQIPHCLLKLCDDPEFERVTKRCADQVLRYSLQERKCDNETYDILNKNFMITQNDKICF